MNSSLHHLHIRKRIYRNLEEFPHKIAWKRRFDQFMYAVAILSPLATVPQIYSVFVYRSVAGVSLTSWTLYGLLNFVWIAYGIIHKEAPITISNIIFAIFNFSIVFGVIIFR